MVEGDPQQTGARGATFIVQAAPAQQGERLDRALAAALPEFSRSRLKALIEAGKVTSGGATLTEPSARVKPGQIFTLTVPQAIAATPRAEKIPLEILYEDADLLVLDKQAGLVVHPAPGNQEGTLVNALLAHCGDSLSGIGGVKRPGIVHRLDKDTSGVMVVAKNDRAHQALSAQFAKHDLERAYKALVWGHPSPPHGTVEGAIGRAPINRKKMAVRKSGGKQAVTHYRTLERFSLDGGPLASLVECRLETGRTHQVRVHMAHLGHAVIGDPVYGRPRRLPKAFAALGEKIAAFKRQALHAYRLGFSHPTSGKKISFTSKLPDDFSNLLKALRTAAKSAVAK